MQLDTTTHLADRGETSSDCMLEDSPESVRVLVVEDEWLISADIEAALVDAGYAVVGVVGTAAAAVLAAGRMRPHLVTMDVRLESERNGIETAAELYARYGIRCLFVSAHDNGDVRRLARGVRPLGWLAKPFTDRQLVNAVRTALWTAEGN